MCQLPTEVGNNKLVSFNRKVLSDDFVLVGKVLMYLKTFPTSRIKTYFGFGGFLLKIPVTELHTEMCCPTGLPSTRLWYTGLADLLELMVEYS